MNNTNPTHAANQRNARSGCEYCQGIVEHQRWCPTVEPKMAYAYQIVADASKISAGDSLILHSLGVVWTECRRDSRLVNWLRAGQCEL